MRAVSCGMNRDACVRDRAHQTRAQLQVRARVSTRFSAENTSPLGNLEVGEQEHEVVQAVVADDGLLRSAQHPAHHQHMRAC